jgi:hypothetical protein
MGILTNVAGMRLTVKSQTPTFEISRLHINRCETRQSPPPLGRGSKPLSKRAVVTFSVELVSRSRR